MYTNDENAQIVLSLLKQFGIKKIVVSPGMTNVPISRSVQIDPWFEVYSVVDERSAAYVANGLAYASGEPVVISCTGATASRNYLPGLTEAYYRKLPIIALTSQRHTSDYGNLVPQITDRSVSQNDVKKLAVHLPVVKDDEDRERCVISVNKALIAATTQGGGPVHINLPVTDFSFETKELPEVRKIDYLSSETILDRLDELKHDLEGKKVALFIGAHNKLPRSAQESIGRFAEKQGAAVIVDHTSNYYGKNSILLAKIADLRRSNNQPDIVIDIGSVTGEYSIGWLFNKPTWRVSEDGEVHDRMHGQTKLIHSSERYFFKSLASINFSVNSNYYDSLSSEVENVAIPEMPLSNTFISQQLSSRLPRDSSIHMGILNSLRNMNFFDIHSSIDGSSNVGGFGIDGPLSTIIGQSFADTNRLVFGLVGDLAAFYDMNALGIRHIGRNIRILVVNNNGGVEFRLNDEIERQLGDDTNEFIAASGHNGSIKDWAESQGFLYMSAKTKEQFMDDVDNFCEPSVSAFQKPVIFEVFTEMSNEQEAYRLIHEANAVSGNDHEEYDEMTPVFDSEIDGFPGTFKKGVKRFTPEFAKKAYKKMRRRG